MSAHVCLNSCYTLTQSGFMGREALSVEVLRGNSTTGVCACACVCVIRKAYHKELNLNRLFEYLYCTGHYPYT